VKYVKIFCTELLLLQCA